MNQRKLLIAITIALVIFSCSQKRDTKLILGNYCDEFGNCIELIDSIHYKQTFQRDTLEMQIRKYEYFPGNDKNNMFGSLAFYDFVYFDTLKMECHLLKDPSNNSKMGFIYDPFYGYSEKGERISAIQLSFDMTDEIYTLQARK